MRAAGVTAARRLDALLVAPDAERGERIICYAGALAGTVFATALALRAPYAWPALTVIAVVAFDLFGGTVVNATRSAKRRFHRPGRSRLHHFAFVAAHVQPFALALLVPGFGWISAGVVYALTLAGAACVLIAPADLRQPVAFAVAALAITAATTSVAVPGELAWFAPVLVIKLLLAHLLPER
ncbi:hypothetical protein ACIP6I_03055 [Streptomyces anulatus]|uniref:hypothetical protein n=1 Tax=Streptomyces anulatus TaxID=1892 RepID=UPI001C280767|nr:hypothetical protein [Streptomyces anulatus]